ncbi:hypothetical protein Poli38472_000269 [Pythium oligandrum]|uniref:Letm1 RBD domain-containing protein n=1 Tax=Pythium oligandrum TaxID=41045 RepID=A0A8K1FHY2_PYTOL|nr:hypothetical protein Poli38472_000269 [Pythium oligandrum]|eukprot:TMW60227.1 hypothetical protein Poli38472_000269 [Pythium oligandrum]
MMAQYLARNVGARRVVMCSLQAPRQPVLAFALEPVSSTRSFSTGMNKDDDATHPQKELSPFQKLQKWMQPFVSGSKALYLENKQAWEIRSRLKASPETAALTRQEMMLLRQAHRDLLKSLPLLIFFAIPLVGYAAPVIGYQFPKQLLPWQFWRPDQKTQFFREDAQARANFYPELIKLLEQIDRKDDCLKEMLALHEDKREGLDPAQVSELEPFFVGPAALSALSRHHVQVLARSIALVPAFSWALQLAPRSTLENYLERRVEQLRVDDAMLLKEGIDNLSLSELEFACEERGIVEGYGDISALQAALKDWMAMYNPKNAQSFPPSLLLHAPALMKPTTRQQA